MQFLIIRMLGSYQMPKPVVKDIIFRRKWKIQDQVY
jgi:hypothetical protein